MNAIAHPCPHCGFLFHLDAVYLSQYGGQSTQCSSCQQVLQLPTLSALTAQPYGGPPKPPPVPTVPYAAPVRTATLRAVKGSAMLDHKRLVVVSGTELPHFCTKCGAPGDGPQFTRTLRWHEPIYYVLLAAGLIPYLIVAFAVSSTGRVSHSYCRKHRLNRMMLIYGGLIAGLLGLVMLVVGLADVVDMRGLGPVGLMVMLVGFITSAASLPTLKVGKIQGSQIWLMGITRSFREQFPDIRQQYVGQLSSMENNGYPR